MREGETREGERVCVCVCVKKRKREREREREGVVCFVTQVAHAAN